MLIEKKGKEAAILYKTAVCAGALGLAQYLYIAVVLQVVLYTASLSSNICIRSVCCMICRSYLGSPWVSFVLSTCPYSQLFGRFAWGPKLRVFLFQSGHP
jgi:hypothetical protein